MYYHLSSDVFEVLCVLGVMTQQTSCSRQTLQSYHCRTTFRHSNSITSGQKSATISFSMSGIRNLT